MMRLAYSFADWTADNFWDKLFAILPKLVTALLVLIIGFWLANLAGKILIRAMTRRNIDPTIHSFIRSLVTITIKFGVVVSALSTLNINLNSFIAALGGAGLAAGLGLQSSISQFASGIQILVNKPFKSGDFIELQAFSGTVGEIHLMYTTLHTPDNKKVVIPNSHITSNAVINYTAEEKRRLDLAFMIGYEDDITQAKEILRKLAQQNENVLKEPVPVIAVKEQVENKVKLIAQLWCQSERYWALHYEMQEAVKNAFDEAGINIPFNQLQVRLVSKDS